MENAKEKRILKGFFVRREADGTEIKISVPRALNVSAKSKQNRAIRSMRTRSHRVSAFFETSRI